MHSNGIAKCLHSTERIERCLFPCNKVGISKKGTAGGEEWLDHGRPAQDLRVPLAFGTICSLQLHSHGAEP